MGVTAAVGAAALLGSGVAAAVPVNWVDCDELLGYHYSAMTPEQAMECGTLEVPVDYAEPEGETTTVGLTRIKASGGEPRSTIVGNPGGPGIDTLGFWQSYPGVDSPPGLYENHDLVAVQPRGMAGSDPLRCDPAYVGPRSENALHDACFGTDDDYMRSMTTENSARDINAVRESLDLATIDFLGVSYGTAIGGAYATLFPEHTGRMVLDSNVHPEWAWSRQARETTLAQEQRMGDIFQWIADNNDTYALGATPLQVYNNWKLVVDQEIGGAPAIVPPGAEAGDLPVELRGTPLEQAAIDTIDTVNPGLSRADGFARAVTLQNVTNTAASGMFDATVGASYSEQSWPMLAHLLQYYNETGNLPHVDIITAQRVREARESPEPVLDTQHSMFDIITCNEDATGGDRMGAQIAEVDRALGGNAMTARADIEGAGANCFGWEPVANPVQINGDELEEKPLILNSEKDAVTPIEGAHAVQRLLGGELVTVGGGDHGTFRTGNPEVDELVMTFLETGEVTATHVDGHPSPDPLAVWGPVEEAEQATEQAAEEGVAVQVAGGEPDAAIYAPYPGEAEQVPTDGRTQHGPEGQAAQAQAQAQEQEQAAQAQEQAPVGGDNAGVDDWYGVHDPFGIHGAVQGAIDDAHHAVEQLVHGAH